MKKLIAIVLSCFMLTNLSGCLSEPSNTDVINKTEINGNNKNKTPYRITDSSKETIEIQISNDTESEVPIFENKYLKITYTGINNNQHNHAISFKIENKSDISITVFAENISVNGYNFSCNLLETISAQEEVNTQVELLKQDIKNNNISSINYIEFYFTCGDSKSNHTLFDTNTIKIIFNEESSKEIPDETISYIEETTEILPTETDIDEENHTEINNSLVVEHDGISIYYLGAEKSNNILYNYELKFLIINNSNRNIFVTSENCSVNDYSLTLSSFYAEIASGKKTNTTLVLYDSELEENHITNIEKVEFSIKCCDSDTYTTIWETTPVTINY